jgi:hypothetical protein
LEFQTCSESGHLKEIILIVKGEGEVSHPNLMNSYWRLEMRNRTRRENRKSTFKRMRESENRVILLDGFSNRKKRHHHLRPDEIFEMLNNLPKVA